MLETLLNVITTGSVFFTVSVGLLVVLSIMGVVNLAHGAFLTIGGYAAVIVSENGWPLWLSILLAPALGFVAGLLTEYLLVRRLYGRPLDTILATWGLAIVITQVISDRFGRSAHFVDEMVSGDPFEFAGVVYSQYRLFILIVSLALGIALTLMLRYTNVGIVARAVILNPNLARVLGINTRRVNAITFAFGSALAAFAGALIVPMSSVDPNMGTPWVITAFMVVLAAGISLPALALSAAVLAASQVLATFYIAPVIGSLLVIAVPILLMRFVPGGIAALLKAR
ncbi:MAG: branched-chain amino acid ABC transporter permease [Hyphomicrobiales bacterium]|nr:branched-chain amino acid ABC transporter permease [Hyphomicrobiales bacterium]